ncbi:hypothetical protein DRP05_10600 [Archaeoglobales archaeon]|nr:MAG: hypothetical protein DRP05_10600 [Archaeoglobales archaeon]
MPGEIRNTYIQWALKDKITDRATRINRTIDRAVRKASLASTQYMYMSAAFEKSLASTASFFAQVDKIERESIIRSRVRNRLLQEAAIKFDVLRSRGKRLFFNCCVKIQGNKHNPRTT